MLEATDHERQIIGSLLMQPELIYRITDLVGPADFGDDAHRTAFECILKQDRAGEPVTYATVGPLLAESAVLKGIQAADYLVGVQEGTPTSAHWEYHARKALEASLTRRAVDTLSGALETLKSRETLRTGLERAIAGIGEVQRALDNADPRTNKAVRPAHAVIDDFLLGLERGEGLPIPTGIDELDYALGGGPSFGEMVILAGRPSMGKTMVALQILDQLTEAGNDCLLISEEMSFQGLAKRLLKRITSFGEDVWPDHTSEIAQHAIEWRTDRATLYLSKPCGTVEKACSVIERGVRNGIRIFAIDYAQLLRGQGRDLYAQRSDVSIRLRELVSSHDILLFTLCQLSRRAEEHEGQPRMSDLKDTGQFEQDADVILFVDWPSVRGDSDCHGNDYFIRIRKNRNRDTREQDVKLEIDRRRQTIVSANYEWNASEWVPV